ncbi:MaoC family dehydratase N-terminal domain-containing protein [Alicyclobacillus tolerans]|uniref:MaoC/PaaZ C-terminal domain-containing protein n=1 Tax=Alicyclobacillus tolerans TaxID=90970 RepID=UPI001F39FAA8|nr:MaoC/PaaZ C-terminal domain-containing protein [Alicyclobacillus tolerans]MCF8566463.1 MaoC family dehydratase N-terminal domain-containing protein [Alicyclobacillus tolerans]
MYFEEFELGQKFELPEITLTAQEIREFAEKYDPQPIHIDALFAEQGLFKGIIASGFHTLSAIWGEWIRLNKFGTEIIGGTGMDFVSWSAPVRAGDRLFTEVEVAEKSLSQSGRRGQVALKFTAKNQDGTVVLTTQGRAYLKSRMAE